MRGLDGCKTAEDGESLSTDEGEEMNKIWLEVIADDDTIERINYIVTSFCLRTIDGWTVVVGSHSCTESYNFGENEEGARGLYAALAGVRMVGGMIQLDENTGKTITVGKK